MSCFEKDLVGNLSISILGSKVLKLPYFVPVKGMLQPTYFVLACPAHFSVCPLSTLLLVSLSPFHVPSVFRLALQFNSFI